MVKLSRGHKLAVVDSVKFFLTVAHIAVIALTFYIILHNLVGIGIVNGSSMSPNLNDNSFIIVNRLSAEKEILDRGDIIVFRTKAHGKKYIKRVIGIPGDSISFSDGHVFVNQKIFIEPYIDQDVRTYDTGDAYNVPDGRYFVLGDNRGNSNDSRYFKNTYVGRDEIIGKVFLNLEGFHVNIIESSKS